MCVNNVCDDVRSAMCLCVVAGDVDSLVRR